MRSAYLLLILAFNLLSQELSASEVRLTSQHITIRRRGLDKVGKQQDLNGKLQINRNYSLGLSGTYLERFDLFEKRAGASLGMKNLGKWNFEIGLLKGNGNKILPESESFLQSYYSWLDGLTPFFFYRDLNYTLTHLHALNIGMEIEKIPHFIIIPVVLFGKATFDDPASTRDILNYGVRLVYYSEMKYSLSLFANKGKEAAQGILGQSTRLVDTLSGGVSFAYFVSPELKTELTIDHSNYRQLRTQFHTTMLNLTWML